MNKLEVSTAIVYVLFCWCVNVLLLLLSFGSTTSTSTIAKYACLSFGTVATYACMKSHHGWLLIETTIMGNKIKDQPRYEIDFLNTQETTVFLFYDVWNISNEYDIAFMFSTWEVIIVSQGGGLISEQGMNPFARRTGYGFGIDNQSNRTCFSKNVMGSSHYMKFWLWVIIQEKIGLLNLSHK